MNITPIFFSPSDTFDSNSSTYRWKAQKNTPTLTMNTSCPDELFIRALIISLQVPL